MDNTENAEKSGRVRTIPLMYVPYRDGVLLVTSQGGRTRNLNARVLTGGERVQAWPVCVEKYPCFIAGRNGHRGH